MKASVAHPPALAAAAGAQAIDPAASPGPPVVLDSITRLEPGHRGRVVVAASHGGGYAGHCAAEGGARAVILNDAGIGLEAAGVASLALLSSIGMAAAAVDATTARIGDGTDMYAHGRISRVNPEAEALGCAVGQTVADCAARLAAAPLPHSALAGLAEARLIARDEPGLPRVVVLDSVSLVEAGDAGQIVIAASHGGLLGGVAATAISVDVFAAVFNDAGVGKDEAGTSRLPALDDRGIIAATVAHDSARIGDGRSMLETGRISYCNRGAAAIGVRPGATVADFIERVTEAARTRGRTAG